MARGSILQYFLPSLSYHLSLRPLFCLFLSGHFTQVLLLLVSVDQQTDMSLSWSETPNGGFLATGSIAAYFWKNLYL